MVCIFERQSNIHASKVLLRQRRRPRLAVAIIGLYVVVAAVPVGSVVSEDTVKVPAMTVGENSSIRTELEGVGCIRTFDPVGFAVEGTLYAQEPLLSLL